jgi:predicted transcriptional regulator
MPEPEGKLTSVQYQIMAVVWERGDSGATATEIWEQNAQNREVGRTTVLKQIQRLEARGWLRRKAEPGVARYVAAVDRDETAQLLAGEFVEEFFDGSLSDLVMSLLGSRKIKPNEVKRLRQILDEHAARRSSGKKRS